MKINCSENIQSNKHIKSQFQKLGQKRLLVCVALRFGFSTFESLSFKGQKNVRKCQSLWGSVKMKYVVSLRTCLFTAKHFARWNLITDWEKVSLRVPKKRLARLSKSQGLGVWTAQTLHPSTLESSPRVSKASVSLPTDLLTYGNV